MENNKVIYDWLSITSKIHTAQQMIEEIGMSELPWELTKGAHGYQDRLYYDHISVHYNGRPDMPVWLEMSGQGCRAFETYGHGDYERLFQIVDYNSSEMNITRLDVAFDDFTGILDMNRICSDTLNQEYVSKANYWEVVQSAKGQTVVIGSPTSEVLIRIYDKARERGREDEIPHWVRVEIQMRNDRCKKFIQLPLGIGNKFCGVMMNYLRYVIPDEEDSNKWRWNLKDYWETLLGNASALSIYEKPGVEYNLLRCDNYVFNTAGNAIDAEIKIRGIDDFMKMLRSRQTRNNPKYDRLVTENSDMIKARKQKGKQNND